MIDKQIREEFDSFALHLKGLDVIGDFGRLREIVMNEIAIRQTALEEIGKIAAKIKENDEDSDSYEIQSNADYIIQIAGKFTKGGK